MSLSGIVRALARRWHITIAGLLLSVLAASLAFTFVPVQYSSSGIVVLVPPERALTSLNNPLLTFDNSLSTTAWILTQTVSGPTVGPALGLDKRHESFTVKNAGGAATVGGSTAEPLIYVSAQSPSPQRSLEIVAMVIGRVRDELTAEQRAMHVLKKTSIQMQSVVDATPPKLDPGAAIAVAGVTFLLGLAITATIACIAERSVLARRARQNMASDRDLARQTSNMRQMNPKSHDYVVLSGDLDGRNNGVITAPLSKAAE